MKKLFSIAIVFICSLMIFAGCGYSGSDTVQGIAFTSSVYYVDKGVPYQLDYRIFPSTGDTSDYKVEFETHDTVNRGKYSFSTKQGIITVIDDYQFAPMEIGVSCGTYMDTCTVMLKEYPSSVYFKEAQTSLTAGAITELVAYANFGGGVGEKRLDTSFYNITAVSSDPTVITVIDSSKLLIKSTGKRGSAKITLDVCSSSGKKITGLETEINVNISNNVYSSVILFNNQYIRNFEDTITISGTVGDELLIEPIFLDRNGFVVSDDKYVVLSLNDGTAEVVKDADGYKIKLVASGDLKLIISSGVYDGNGNIVVFELKCNVIIST